MRNRFFCYITIDHDKLLTLKILIVCERKFNVPTFPFFACYDDCSQAEVKARCHYPGKESVNPGWRMFKYFDSNITDEVSASHNETPYVNYSNRQPAATFAI